MITIVMNTGKDPESEQLIKEKGLEAVYQLNYDLFSKDQYLSSYTAQKLPLGTYLTKRMELLNIPIIAI